MLGRTHTYTLLFMPREENDVREATVAEMLHRFRLAKATSRSERDKLRAMGKAPKKMWYENDSNRPQPPHSIFTETVGTKVFDFGQQNEVIDFSQTQMMFENRDRQIHERVENLNLETIEPKCVITPLHLPKQSRQPSIEKQIKTNTFSHIASKDSQNVKTIQQDDLTEASLPPPTPWRERFRFSLSNNLHPNSVESSYNPNQNVQNSANDIYSRIRMQPNIPTTQK